MVLCLWGKKVLLLSPFKKSRYRARATPGTCRGAGPGTDPISACSAWLCALRGHIGMRL